MEGDPEVRTNLDRGLAEEGFEVSSVGDGESGLKLAAEADVDLLLVDMNLPKMRGVEVLQRIREIKPRLPIFALGSLDETGPVVLGLDAGADDYVTKSISPRRLAALVRARLRRNDEDGSISVGPITLDLAAHKVSADGRECQLSAREVALLATLMRHEGQAVSKDELLRSVWNVDFDPGTNVVSVYIGALRKKIGPDLIQTVRGRGYRFQPPSSRSDLDSGNCWD